MNREVERFKNRVFGVFFGFVLVIMLVLMIFSAQIVSAEEDEVPEYAPSYEKEVFDLSHGRWEAVVDYREPFEQNQDKMVYIEARFKVDDLEDKGGLLLKFSSHLLNEQFIQSWYNDTYDEWSYIALVKDDGSVDYNNTVDLDISDGVHFIKDTDIDLASNDTDEYVIRIDTGIDAWDEEDIPSQIHGVVTEYNYEGGYEPHDGYVMTRDMAWTVSDMNTDYLNKYSQYEDYVSEMEQKYDELQDDYETIQDDSYTAGYNDGYSDSMPFDVYFDSDDSLLVMLEDDTEMNFGDGLYDEAHSDGYSAGASDGFDGSSFYSTLAGGLSSILAIELLPNLSIATIIGISFGFGILAFLLRQGRM